MVIEKGMVSMMEETRKFTPRDELSQEARIKSMEQYQSMYRRSLDDSEGFWAEFAEELNWDKQWDKVLEENFDKGKVKWFVGGRLNAAYNCLDRHLKAGRKDKVAIIWEGESGGSKTYTYEKLHKEVCRFASALRRLGIKKGDRIAIYLPMIPELPIAMLACARIGAIHSVVFCKFSAESLRERILDCGAELLITSNYRLDKGKILPSKEDADTALKGCPGVKKVVVVRRLKEEVGMVNGRDCFWDELTSQENDLSSSHPEAVDAEDPLFILYTSGSTGRPKGVLHTTAGYLLHTKKSFEWIFDYRDEEIFWCTEDISWITGHSYAVYGPLCAGATSLIFEGVSSYPKPDRFWEIVDKYKVNLLYTSPAVLRSCMKEGDEWVEKHDLKSLRILGTVGEPINPEAWMWYHRVLERGGAPLSIRGGRRRQVES